MSLPAHHGPLPVAVERIDALLPQTQCTRCGYDDCHAYAEALARGETDINRCPPGGEATLRALAALLRRPPLPLAPECGTVPVLAEIAFVEEDRCIGCFKCVRACPVDAIVGAPKLMHTVIAADCSGCELCLPVCPTDCIVMIPRPAVLPPPQALTERWRVLHGAREARLEHDRSERDTARRLRRGASLKDRAGGFDIAAAIARARKRKNEGSAA
jgi:electron transport complex protein RnfB